MNAPSLDLAGRTLSSLRIMGVYTKEGCTQDPKRNLGQIVYKVLKGVWAWLFCGIALQIGEAPRRHFIAE